MSPFYVDIIKMTSGLSMAVINPQLNRRCWIIHWSYDLLPETLV
jgi:hypothetical protein